MLDLADEPSFIEGVSNAAMASQSSIPRGRRKIPIQWTRIMKVEGSQDDEVQVFTIEEDANHVYELPDSIKKKSKKQ